MNSENETSRRNSPEKTEPWSTRAEFGNEIGERFRS